MDKKYELTNDIKIVEGRKLYRIRALKDFDIIKKGRLGGFVESESNLSHNGDCWIFSNACVFDRAEVYGDAKVCSAAQIFNNAIVCGNAIVSHDAKVFNNAVICGQAQIYEDVRVYGNANVFGRAQIFGNAEIYDKARVYGSVQIKDYITICGDAAVCGFCIELSGNAVIKNINDYIVFKNNWSSGRYFTWTKSNNLWSENSFYGTGKELIEKAYKDSIESGMKYEAYVKFVEDNFL